MLISELEKMKPFTKAVWSKSGSVEFQIKWIILKVKKDIQKIGYFKSETLVHYHSKMIGHFGIILVPYWLSHHISTCYQQECYTKKNKWICYKYNLLSVVSMLK